MNFDEIYDRKGTHCVKYNAVKTAQRPQDALVMTLADMDLPCCPAIQQAIIERAEHPFYGYQQFDEQLPEVVCAWAKAHSAALLDPRTIQITPQRQYGDCSVFAGIHQAGRRNLDPEPILQSFPQGRHAEPASLRDERTDPEGGSL